MRVSGVAGLTHPALREVLSDFAARAVEGEAPVQMRAGLCLLRGNWRVQRGLQVVQREER